MINCAANIHCLSSSSTKEWVLTGWANHNNSHSAFPASLVPRGGHLTNQVLANETQLEVWWDTKFWEVLSLFCFALHSQWRSQVSLMQSQSSLSLFSCLEYGHNGAGVMITTLQPHGQAKTITESLALMSLNHWTSIHNHSSLYLLPYFKNYTFVYTIIIRFSVYM